MASTQMSRVYFLPGMMCDERLFSSQIHALSCSCQCSVVSFESGESIEDYARLVLQQVRRDQDVADATSATAACAQPKVILAGLSMGGIVAMQCMHQAPTLIDAVVLMDTNHLAELPTRRALRMPQIKRVLNGELETVLIEEMKPLYLAPVNQSDNHLLSLVLTMASDLGPDVFARQSRAIMNRGDHTLALSQWSKPALILHGAHDNLCPPERHVMMHELMPHATLTAIADAGHLPTLESPDCVTEVMRKFIESLN